MLGTQAQPLEVRYHRLEITLRWIAGIAVIAIVALAAVLVWTATRGAPTVDAQQMADDVAAIWTEHDPSLVASVYAEDAVVVDAWGYRTEGRDAIAGAAELAGVVGMSVVADAPPVQADGSLIYPATVAITGTGPTYTEAQILTRLELNDAGLVARHEDFLLVQQPADIAGDLAAAWTAHDGAAVAALYAPDAVFVDDSGYVTNGAADIAEYVEKGGVVGFAVTVDGPEMQTGNMVFFQSTQKATVNGGPETVSVLTMLELNEDGLIARQQDFVATPEPAD